MHNPPAPPNLPRRRLAVIVRGVIQGVGFRPFICQTAQAGGLSGWVRNDTDNVRIEVEGDGPALDAFLETIQRDHPPQARIHAVDIHEIASQDDGRDGEPKFLIRQSSALSPPRPIVPADMACCAECLSEINDPAQRRYRYPFTNCTNCGPRWSIIEQLPYDRSRTSMATFSMCGDCRMEYGNPSDRRFHAQPIACPRCGPTVHLLDCRGRPMASGNTALAAAAAAVAEGKILAIKGLGGFQLLADATSDNATRQLRLRKRRPDRPFALMIPSLDMVKVYCEVSEGEARALQSSRAPIVLLRKKNLVPFPLSPIHYPLSEDIAPGNPYLGVMLPYTPLHHLLMAAIARPIVCTSGNLAEEPMAIDLPEALERLGPIADAFLTHDRPIVRPVDDSVVRLGPKGIEVLRRARGYAPLPIDVRIDGDRSPTVLALGGHLKNTVALALSRTRPGAAVQVVLSAHVGDLDSVASVEVFQRAADDLLRFFQVKPATVVCDLHPDYASTRRAEELAARCHATLLRVQHHHAHVAACMAEHNLGGPVLGLSWDGAGYGPDGTIWGGEALRCEGAEFRRVASLKPFPLPGGDAAAREPRRSALGLLFAMSNPQAARYAAEWFDRHEIDLLLSALERKINAPQTSSMGRLFDAVAAICGLPPVISFEGQAAMALEYATDAQETDAYSISLIPGNDVWQADWSPMIHAALSDRASGVSVGRISGRFHNALADLALAIAEKAGESLPIALTGGCFQNALLAARVRRRLSSAGFQVYTHQKVPPGDGGLALGQALLALRQP